jgi:hypothetical protein
MKILLAITTICIALIATSSAYDPRVAYSIPYLQPDPSLKTTDPLYLGMMGGEVTIDLDYTLPPIFGGSIITPTPERDWMYVETRPKFMNSSDVKITANSSYDVPLDILNKYVPDGEESWL